MIFSILSIRLHLHLEKYLYYEDKIINKSRHTLPEIPNQIS